MQPRFSSPSPYDVAAAGQEVQGLCHSPQHKLRRAPCLPTLILMHLFPTFIAPAIGQAPRTIAPWAHKLQRTRDAKKLMIFSSCHLFVLPGSLPASAVAPLRAKLNGVCGQLAEGGGKLALTLCDGFGVPEHILQQSPIAANWRTMC